jgi:hypothetical protein
MSIPVRLTGSCGVSGTAALLHHRRLHHHQGGFYILPSTIFELAFSTFKNREFSRGHLEK